VKTGLIPSLLRALTSHADLAQRSQDAAIKSAALESLLHYREQFETLQQLADDGHLAEAVQATRQLQTDLDHAPRALELSDALAHFKVSFSSYYLVLAP